MAYDIFISYSTTDQKIVEGLSAYLEQNGIRCFVAYRDIPKGIVWAKAITEAIEKSKLMIVVFSEHFNRSEQVDREIEMCIEERKPILTFRIEDTAFSGAKKYYLKNINWIDAFPNPKEYFGKLLTSIKNLFPELEIEINKREERAKIKNGSHTTTEDILTYNNMTGKVDVYVVGYEINSQENWVAKFWENGIVQSLTNPGPIRKWGAAQALCVHVLGNDIYVVGHDNFTAKFWKNGVEQCLTDKSGVWTYARSVYVSDNDVYVVGGGYAHKKKVVKLWKNGVTYNLTYEREPNACSIFVSNNDVYIAGSELKILKGDVATLWKNGAAHNLTKKESNANSVFVVGNDVYVAGHENWHATLWKNGVAQSLTDRKNSSKAHSVCVSGNDVYVAGYEKWHAILWKNGVAQSLTDGKCRAEAHSVCVLGNEVYVAGYEENTQGKKVAKLWKNGSTQNLTDGNYNTEALSVFVNKYP